MSYPTFIRVSGEAFDADQIEGDDPFYQTDAEWARTAAQSDATSDFIAASAARIKARKLAADGWTVTVKDCGDGRSELAA